MQQSILEIKRRLARLLVEKSYREGDFVLASGRRSDYYFDCRVTALHAEGSWLIVSALSVVSAVAVNSISCARTGTFTVYEIVFCSNSGSSS